MAQLSIGELAKLANVSNRTIRYYEELGLLQPQLRGSNRYRYYNAGDMNRLQTIRLLQDSGLSLKEIVKTLKPMIENESAKDRPETGPELALRVQRSLLFQKAKISERIDQLEKTLVGIEKSLNLLGNCLSCGDPVQSQPCSRCEEGAVEVKSKISQQFENKSENKNEPRETH